MSKLPTFQHPGFPRIGAVEIFRKNAAKEIDDLENEVRTEIENIEAYEQTTISHTCLLYTSPSPRDLSTSRMPSSA